MKRATLIARIARLHEIGDTCGMSRVPHERRDFVALALVGVLAAEAGISHEELMGLLRGEPAEAEEAPRASGPGPVVLPAWPAGGAK